MFTGIITDVGRVRAHDPCADGRIEILTAFPPEALRLGASIACAGLCLTVVDSGRDGERRWFAVTASAETRARSTCGTWQVGDAVNLERALRVGDELAGHIVTGHVDGVGTVLEITPEARSHRLVIGAPPALSRLIAAKGSITVDGVSLTVNSLEQDAFAVNIIPHSWAVTSLASLAVGSRVNLEVDLLARYVARLAEGA